MAESAISPGELFKNKAPVEIKQLVRKPNDEFFVFNKTAYAAEVQKAVSATKINPAYKKYLNDLVDYMQNKKSNKLITESFDVNKSKIDSEEVAKYFGEVLGPLHILSNSATKYTKIVFPVRSNYELFDFFLEDSKGVYHGFSSKVEGGTSNTLSPKEIESRISKLKITNPQEKLAADVITTFTNEPTLSGILIAAGALTSKNKLPSKLSASTKSALSKINFDSDGPKVQNKSQMPLSKIGLSNMSAHVKFMNDYILPRLRTISEADKNKYLSGKKEYLGVNLAYGYGLLIVDANKEDVFDISLLVKKCFQDLNVVKMGLKNGIPSFKLSNISKSEDKYYMRSKHRFTTIKDKLGVQL
jgi:hypothetical protein